MLVQRVRAERAHLGSTCHTFNEHINTEVSSDTKERSSTVPRWYFLPAGPNRGQGDGTCGNYPFLRL